MKVANRILSVQVCKECRFLEILRVTSRTQHELLNYHISQALTFAKLLKDFRYEPTYYDQ